jgi:hypothetical protein
MTTIWIYAASVAVLGLLVCTLLGYKFPEYYRVVEYTERHHYGESTHYRVEQSRYRLLWFATQYWMQECGWVPYSTENYDYAVVFMSKERSARAMRKARKSKPSKVVFESSVSESDGASVG